MRATRTFTDNTGVMRKNGEEWLIKMEDTEAHIPDVYEDVRKIFSSATRSLGNDINFSSGTIMFGPFN